MIKKVSVDQLGTGMYIHDFNCDWLHHPFLTSRVKIKDDRIIEKIIAQGIKEVYIDTDRGMDVPGAPTEQEVGREIQEHINKMAETDTKPVRDVPLKKELSRAREIKKEAKVAVCDILEEVRIGGQIKTDKAEQVVDKMIDSIFRNQDALVSLGRIKQTDEYTFMHSMSVCVLMISFGKHLDFDESALREVGIGAMLHDIGKMKVPLEILNCKGALTDEQFAIMKKHVEYSNILLNETSGISEMSVILASQHHERVDGRGYPAGLKGDEISLYGQAAAIADVYDAMTSQRCYQRRFEPTEVLRKLYEWKGSYNIDLVQQFVRCVGIYPVGSLVLLDNKLLAVVIDRGSDNLLQPVVRVVYDTRKDRYVLPVYDLDLSRPNSHKVSGYELPERWNIKPEMYL